MSQTRIAVKVSRHSAFYSPLIATLAAGFLQDEGLEAIYSVLEPGERSRHLLQSRQVDVMQSAVGSNWAPMEAGETDLPLHFAQINRRDGFFLASRKERSDFSWNDLEGATFLADHGRQPMLMLRYAAARQGVNWENVHVIDAGDVAQMEEAFRGGQGDFIHLQGPAPQQLERQGLAQVVASVGEAMAPVAFSSLTATREFLATDAAAAFTRAYRKAREWAQKSPPEEIAEKESSYFPGIDSAALAKTIASYQELGCWTGDIAIAKDLYEQALEVFLHGKAITQRHPYEKVVTDPPA